MSIIAECAKILKRHNLAHHMSTKDIMKNSVYSSPLITETFFNMLIDDCQISDEGSQLSEENREELEKKRREAVKSLSQLSVFNSVTSLNSKREKKTDIVRHIRKREVPQAFFHALNLYQVTRKRSLIDLDCQKGLCISYDRLRNFLIHLANSILSRWTEEDLVYPIQGLKGVFLTAAGDNGDSNSRSYTCRNDFHGFVLSVVFHPTKDNPGVPTVMDNDILLDSEGKKTTVKLIPASYTNIDLTKTLNNCNDLKVPHLPDEMSLIYSAAPPLKQHVSDIFGWLDHVKEIMEREGSEGDDLISFAAYNAEKQGPVPTPITPCHILPVSEQSSIDPTMLCHAMMHTIKMTNFFNPGQKAVITFDGPLFLLAKKLQWKYSEIVGEDKILVRPGDLHIEKLWWEINGSLLEGSGWTTMLNNADIATTGRAQSYLSGSHIYRSRYMHQVTAATLHILMHHAYEEYRCSVDIPYRILEFDEWLNNKCVEEPQVMYWDKVLQYQMLGLQVKAQFVSLLFFNICMFILLDLYDFELRL